MERDFEPIDSEFDPTPQPTDEDEALHSLDDTTFRPLPELSAVWEPLEASPAPERQPSERLARLRRHALIAGVAVVSFVAGGVTARMSTQVPVLFGERRPALESTASYQETGELTTDQVEPQTPAEPVEAPAEEPSETTLTPPSYDTGYDTTDDRPWSRRDESYDESDSTDDTTQTNSETYVWKLDDEGDLNLTYDTQRDRVTLDYNDHGVDLTLDDLFNDKNDTWGQNATPDDTLQTEQRYNTYGTGDDATDAERDVWGWRGWTDARDSYHT